ncbi:MAG: DOMON-like domain-containing protein [Deltaproteobacteria bacterium]|nr:DOMON-like domain-containing protein [Deltaproteobacteria bacterium]
MNGQDFSLRPFSPLSPHLDFRITGHIARRADILAIRYDLHGPRAKLVIPGPAELPSRKHGLWEETCFELFLGVKDSPRYWELNLSPAGSWNVYHFAGYRQGMTEETAFPSLPLSVRRRPELLRVALELEIERIVGADQPLAVALAAVIKSRDHGLTYWALTHPGPRPDFHRRDSFLMEL